MTSGPATERALAATGTQALDGERPKRILVVNRGTPRPDQDSGSLDLANMLSIFRGLGHEVTFVPVKLIPRGVPLPNIAQRDGLYTEDLERQGIECLHAPRNLSLGSYLRKHGRKFDVIVVHRGRVLARFLRAIRKFAPQAKLIFNTVDLHYLREEREAELLSNVFYKWKAKDTKWRELFAVRGADTTLVLSEVEREILAKEVPEAKIEILPLIRDIPGRTRGFEGRSGVLFVGGFRHRPNIDAVRYFLAEVWPKVLEKRPDLPFWIAGSSMPAEVLAWASDTVHPLGYIPDLTDLHGQVCATVAPLRYGAGLKGKVAASLGYGVPCITTSVGVEGSGLVDGENIIVRDDPEGIAAAIVELHDDPERWEALSQRGLEFAAARYGRKTIEKRLAAMIGDTPQLSAPSTE